MSSIALMKPLSGNMNRFEYEQKFEKEFKRLKKKYRSLPDDMVRFERVLAANPVGIGAAFTIIHDGDLVLIVKARLACQSLRAKFLRIVYAYHRDRSTFMYIEIYFKGDKENEDRNRISDFLKQ